VSAMRAGEQTVHQNAARHGSAHAQLGCAPRSGRQRKRPKGNAVQHQSVQVHTRPADPLCCEPPAKHGFVLTCYCKQVRRRHGLCVFTGAQ